MNEGSEEEIDHVESVVRHFPAGNREALFRIRCAKGNNWTTEDNPLDEAYEKGYVSVRLEVDENEQPRRTKTGRVTDRRVVATFITLNPEVQSAWPFVWLPQKLRYGYVELLSDEDAYTVLDWRHKNVFDAK